MPQVVKPEATREVGAADERTERVIYYVARGQRPAFARGEHVLELTAQKDALLTA